jgi:serine O-acetyltransferase
MYMSILSHGTLEQCLSFVLANRLADSVLLPTQLMEIFNSVLFADDVNGKFVRSALRRDIQAGLHSRPLLVRFSAPPEPFLTLKTSPKRQNTPFNPAINTL